MRPHLPCFPTSCLEAFMPNLHIDVEYSTRIDAMDTFRHEGFESK